MALLALAALAIAALCVTTMASPDPPASGDWVIGASEDVSKTGEALTVAGNLIVQSGGRLSLTDCDLRLDMPASGAFHIAVARGGTLVTDGGTTIDSTDEGMYYNLTVEGRATIGHTTVRRLDGTSSPTPLVAALGGLVVRSSDVLLHNSTIELSRGYAVAFEPAGLLSSITPTMEDCTVRGNGGGIYVEGILLASADPSIRRCRVYGSSNGEVLVIAASPRFVGCTFGQLLSPSLLGVSVAALAEPVLDGCAFQYTGAALNVLYASPTVRDCTFTYCVLGMLDIGGAGAVVSSTFENCGMALMLNSSSVSVRDCAVTGFLTVASAVSVDAGAPTLTNVTVDLDAVGGAVSLANDTAAVLDRCHLTGSGASDAVVVDRSAPTLRDCVVRGGLTGIDLRWSEARLERNNILGNSGWGVVAAHRAPVMVDNLYGTGAISNGLGSFLQLYQLTVRVELPGGAPAAGASVVAVDALEAEVANVTVASDGLAFDLLLAEHHIDMEYVRYDHQPYALAARLGTMRSLTSVSLDGADRAVALVLVPNARPTVWVLSPAEGAMLDPWANRAGFRLNGSGEDSDGDVLSSSWLLDGAPVEGSGAWCVTVRPSAGAHTATLVVSDGMGDPVTVEVSFTVMSGPCPSNRFTITSPVDDSVLAHDEDFLVAVDVHVELDPYSPGVTAVLEVQWYVDGTEVTPGPDGRVDPLEWDAHTVSARATPPSSPWSPGPLVDSVSIYVQAPPPRAVAVIAAPANRSMFVEGSVVHLSANGSYVESYGDGVGPTVMFWRSDVDGLLGEGMELDVEDLSVGLHVVTLEVTTDPPVVWANASVTIVVLAVPPPNVPPVAVAALSTSGRPYTGDVINFTANGSFDPDGEVLYFQWDFGDGNSSAGMNVSHVYAHVGNYSVTLTVFDGKANASVTLPSLFVDARKGPPPTPPDDDGDVTAGERTAGWVGLLLLVTILVLLLVLVARRRRSPG